MKWTNSGDSMNKSIRMQHRGAFTLIEILIVVAIISILAATLFPVFARARENARRASCSSNLKQIGVAWHMYVQDYDDVMPTYELIYYTGVEPLLRPYIKNAQVFVCPSTDKLLTGYGVPVINAAWDTSAYRSTATISTSQQTLFSRVPRPTLICLMAEYRYGSALKYTFTATNPTDGSYGGFPVLDRHLGGSNYLFFDGHVKWLKSETVTQPYATNNAIHFYWNKNLPDG